MRHSILKTCQEGQLLFDPTYKYDQGTKNYDTKKLRTPSWTDRVLFSQTMPCLRLQKYGRSEITISDHRPIFAQFSANIRRVDADAKQTVEQNLISQFQTLKLNSRNPDSLLEDLNLVGKNQ